MPLPRPDVEGILNRRGSGSHVCGEPHLRNVCSRWKNQVCWGEGELTKKRGGRWLTVSAADGILTSRSLACPSFVFCGILFKATGLFYHFLFLNFLFPLLSCCFFCVFFLSQHNCWCSATIELGTYPHSNNEQNSELCWHSCFFLGC